MLLTSPNQIVPTMKSVRKRALFVGLIFLSTAGFLWFGSNRLPKRHNWTVLEQPIQPVEGFSSTNSFQVDVSYEYYIEVACLQTVDQDNYEVS